MASGRGVSLDELLSASVPLTADHAAALVGQLCRREPMDSVEPSDVAFGPEHVWLDRAGAVHLSPGVEPSVRDLGATSGTVAARSSPRRVGTSARGPGARDRACHRADRCGAVRLCARVGGGARAFRASGSTCGAAGAFHGGGGRRHRSARRSWSLTKKCWLLTPRPQLPRLTTTIRRRSPLLATLRPEPTIRSFIDRSPMAAGRRGGPGRRSVCGRRSGRPPVVAPSRRPRNQHDGGDHLAPRGHRAPPGRSGAATS